MLNPKKVNIVKHMFNGKNYFIIPDYQRNYDWNEANCYELFQDVVHCAEKNEKHFLGTFVQFVSKIDEKNNTKEFLIIDGQQRLTTIYLFIKALYDCAKVAKKSLDAEKDQKRTGELNELMTELNNYLRSNNDDPEKFIRLKLIKKDERQLKNLIINNITNSFEKDSHVILNYKYLKERINRYIKETNSNIEKLLYGLKNLEFIEITLEANIDRPQVIFDRINSTGKALLLVDKVRNFLLMPNISKKIDAQEWFEIENNLKSNQKLLNDFVIKYITYKIGSVSEDQAYLKFKNYIFDKNISEQNILNEMLRLSEYYKAFVGLDSNYNGEINELLKSFRMIDQTTIYTFLFSIFSDHQNGLINNSDLKKIINFFINYLIRRTFVKSIKSLNKFFPTLYRKCFDLTDENQKVTLKNDEYVNQIMQHIMFATKGRHVFPTDEDFRKNIVDFPLYKDNSKKFILSTIENYFSKEKILTDSKDITIEHIMPQSTDKNKAWKEALGKDWKDIFDKYLHTIGNLTLTGQNIDLKALPIEKKVELLKDPAVSKFVFLNLDIINQNHWDKQTIVNRGNRLANILVQIFSYPKIAQNSTNNNNALISNFERPNNIHFNFLGDEYIVNSWRELYRKIGDVLFTNKKYYEKILDCAEKNSTFLTGNINSQAVFTFEKSIDRVELFNNTKNDHIYMLMSYGKDNILKNIKNICELLGISFEKSFKLIEVTRNEEIKSKPTLTKNKMYPIFWQYFKSEFDKSDTMLLAKIPINDNYTNYCIDFKSNSSYAYLSVSLAHDFKPSLKIHVWITDKDNKIKKQFYLINNEIDNIKSRVNNEFQIDIDKKEGSRNSEIYTLVDNFNIYDETTFKDSAKKAVQILLKYDELFSPLFIKKKK